eukprot:TRINITY_DN10804_c0_g2_i2.p1 TRINITY_DN10804_c0_g2~~TRINITY_DN10804_c0_g2_i2.p1  ORF type:complete len:381 (+),score=62.10 TRINITY_DN10804_c0_g2_i2:84-1226(+)
MGCISSASVISQVSGAGPDQQEERLKVADGNIREFYDIGELIRSGSMCEVHRACSRNSNHTRAVKIVRKSTSTEEALERQDALEVEIRMLQRVNHTHIVRFYDLYEDSNFLYSVMELCCGGEVFDKIVELKRCDENTAAFIGKQMLEAIEYLHRLNIVHRGIKAEHFLFSDRAISSHIKLIDFAMSCRCEEGQYLTEICGAPHYLAPELLQQRYSKMVDVWAFGVMMYLLLCGHYPHAGARVAKIMFNILNMNIDWHDTATLTPMCIDFLEEALDFSPETRATASTLLQHGWIKQAVLPNCERTGCSELPQETSGGVRNRKVDELGNNQLEEMETIQRPAALGEESRSESRSISAPGCLQSAKPSAGEAGSVPAQGGCLS